MRFVKQPRPDAIARMRRALDAFAIEGVPTTIPLHQAIMRDESFRAGRYSTGSIPEILAALTARAKED